MLIVDLREHIQESKNGVNLKKIEQNKESLLLKVSKAHNKKVHLEIQHIQDEIGEVLKSNKREYSQGYKQGREDENSFRYNNNQQEKTHNRSRGRAPLKEVKKESSSENNNNFTLDLILDTMLLM